MVLDMKKNRRPAAEDPTPRSKTFDNAEQGPDKDINHARQLLIDQYDMLEDRNRMITVQKVDGLDMPDRQGEYMGALSEVYAQNRLQSELQLPLDLKQSAYSIQKSDSRRSFDDIGLLLNQLKINSNDTGSYSKGSVSRGKQISVIMRIKDPQSREGVIDDCFSPLSAFRDGVKAATSSPQKQGLPDDSFNASFGDPITPASRY